jgi:hypothetical protein
MVSSMIATPIVGKLIAAVVTRRSFGFTCDDGPMMWSLLLPQVVAMLAMALAAHEAKNPASSRLIDEPILNTVIVLMVVTSELGPVSTEVFGKRIAAEKEKALASSEVVGA